MPESFEFEPVSKCSLWLFESMVSDEPVNIDFGELDEIESDFFELALSGLDCCLGIIANLKNIIFISFCQLI